MANGQAGEGSAGEAAAHGRRVSLKEKLAFTCGTITAHSSGGALMQLLTPIYQITLGINPLLLGAVQTIMRAWDAVTDPLMAGISDNTRTRWGRRRPYILAGGILASLCFPLIWMPSAEWSETGLFTYLLITSLLFLTAQTMYLIPYEALGMELTTGYHEKTRLYAFRGYLMPVLNLGTAWLYAFIQMDFFADPLSGVRAIAVAFGALMLVTSVIPAIFLRERSERTIRRIKRVGIVRSIRETLQNRAFLCIAVMAVFGSLTANIFGQLGLYAKIYVLYEGDTKSGAILAGFESVCFYLVFYLSIFYGVKLSQRFSKRKVVLATACLTFLGGPAKLLLYNPEYPYLILLLVLFSAPSGALGSFMTNSLMADIANYDEWKTGERREAMFTAVAGWLYKVSISLSGILSGAVLVAIGFDVSLGGLQSEFTRRWLVVGLALSSIVPALITFGAMYFYPLDEATINRCADELKAREAEAAAPDPDAAGGGPAS